MISAVDIHLQIKRGPGHPDHDIRGEGGGGQFKKNVFSALRASVWSKNMEGPAPPGPSPGSATGFDLPFRSFLLGFVLSYLFFLLNVIKTQMLSVNSYVHLGDLPRKAQESLLRSLASII